MGLWGGNNQRIEAVPIERLTKRANEQRILKEAKAGMKIEAQEARKNQFKTTGSQFEQSSQVVGEQVGRFAGVAERQQVNFSEQQQQLRQMFGHGEKIWAVNNNPVIINNDLNSSRSDPWDETSSMFGFGPHGEKSGMF